ncbi:hypothetical protein CDL12_25347 [Handroanthus impetiginosus]|uniref:Uncharacterized protein n=1 Tax=Handroanthus impetiginosus TaxID=429701 RepID=A0A2G9GA13_9LAMI|nr:hypothetical protein CDL12_25347 [Handroanthus impetiginosus]
MFHVVFSTFLESRDRGERHFLTKLGLERKGSGRYVISISLRTYFDGNSQELPQRELPILFCLSFSESLFNHLCSQVALRRRRG